MGWLFKPHSLSSKKLGQRSETGVQFWNSKHVCFLSSLEARGYAELLAPGFFQSYCMGLGVGGSFQNVAR